MFNWLRRLFGAGTATSAGDRGERLAAEWLERERGFRIVARNWRSPHDRRDELDVIAREGEALVFVEVKTRAADALVPGYYAVDERKKRVVRRAAAAYRRGLREKTGDRALRYCRGGNACGRHGGRARGAALRKYCALPPEFSRVIGCAGA